MEQIFYLAKDATGQSQIAAALAKIAFPDATMTVTDGLDESGMAALVSALTDNTLSEIIVCAPIVASHAAGKFTAAQAITLIPKLLTARQGTNVTGTCQANSTVTNIVLASSGPSAVNDFYNLRLIATAGDVAVSRLITDYVGSSKICTMVSTGTAVDASETYTVYMTNYLHIVGETYQGSGTGNACYTAWMNLFPSANKTPSLVYYMSGLASLYLKTALTATAVAAGTISDTSEFTAGAYDGKDYYVGIVSGTLGVGQIRKIASNTVTVLTLTDNWYVTPTGSPIKYHLKDGPNRMLWDQYLTYGIATYFSGLHQSAQESISLLTRMMDQYGDLSAGSKFGYEETALLEKYAGLGKAIFEAKCAGVVT